MNQSMEPVVFAIPGDLHLTLPGLENHRTAMHVIDEINRLVKPDFVQFMGDNVQHATDKQFELFKDLAGRLSVPWYALVGDHDIHDDPEAAGFRRWIGDTYGSMSLDGFRFLRLNTQEAKPVGLSEKQLQWLEAELASARERKERIVIFQHNYPYQIWETFAGPGIDRWRMIVQSSRIAAIFSGHTHYGQIANDGRNVCVVVRSIGDPEGGSAGYAIALVHGEDFAITYRCAHERGPIVLIAHPRETLLALGPEHVVRGRDEIRVRVWSEQPIVAVRARIDVGSWFALKHMGEQTWADELFGERLAKGEHQLTVEASDQSGNLASKTIGFPVDQTGRYTAAPAVRPPVFATNFC